MIQSSEVSKMKECSISKIYSINTIILADSPDDRFSRNVKHSVANYVQSIV